MCNKGMPKFALYHDEYWVGEVWIKAAGLMKSNDPKDLSDLTQPESMVYEVIIKPDPEMAHLIKPAMYTFFSKNTCDHEYDCCGCRSYSVSGLFTMPYADDEYMVVVSSRRNY